MARGDSGTLSIAGNGKERVPTGTCNYLRSYQQSGLVRVELYYHGTPKETHTLLRGDTLHDKLFDEVIITDLTGSTNTVRLLYGPGQVTVNSEGIEVSIDDTTPLRVNMTNGSVTVNQSVPNDIVPLDDVTVSDSAVQLVAASGDMLEAIIAIPDTETGGIRYGDNTVTAGKGAYLGPGGSVVVSLESHAIHAIRAGAVDVNVTLTKLERV